MAFKDRRDAGRRLGEALRGYAKDAPIVLGLPRGGVPVAYEVAKALDAPLDVVVVRKLGAPGQPELAMGAVAQGVTVVNDDVVRALAIDAKTVQRAARQKQEEVDARVRMFQGPRQLPDVKGRVVLVVDDGVATGSTILAAAQVLRSLGPDKLVLAVPVLSPRVVEKLEAACDELVYLRCEADFYAVGQWYDDFSQTTDDEVIALLEAGMVH